MSENNTQPQRHRRVDRRREEEAAQKPARAVRERKAQAGSDMSGWLPGNDRQNGSAPAVRPVQRQTTPVQPATQAAPAKMPNEERAERRRKKQQTKKTVLTVFFGVLTAAVLFCAVSAFNDYVGARSQLMDFRAERRQAEEELQAERDAWKRRVNDFKSIVQYRSFIERYASQFHLDPAFVTAIIKCESSFDPMAVSSVGAKGLMQLMPDSISWVGPKCGVSASNANAVFDPETAIHMGCWLAKYIADQFDGDPILTACAYHAGWGNVRSWLSKYSGDGKTLTLDEIPMADTRSYARKVMEAYAIYQQYLY